MKPGPQVRSEMTKPRGGCLSPEEHTSATGRSEGESCRESQPDRNSLTCPFAGVYCFGCVRGKCWWPGFIRVPAHKRKPINPSVGSRPTLPANTGIVFGLGIIELLSNKPHRLLPRSPNRCPITTEASSKVIPLVLPSSRCSQPPEIQPAKPGCRADHATRARHRCNRRFPHRIRGEDSGRVTTNAD